MIEIPTEVLEKLSGIFDTEEAQSSCINCARDLDDDDHATTVNTGFLGKPKVCKTCVDAIPNILENLDTTIAEGNF